MIIVVPSYTMQHVSSQCGNLSNIMTCTAKLCNMYHINIRHHAIATIDDCHAFQYNSVAFSTIILPTALQSKDTLLALQRG